MSKVLKEKMYLTSNSQDVSLQKRIILFGLMITELKRAQQIRVRIRNEKVWKKDKKKLQIF